MRVSNDSFFEKIGGENFNNAKNGHTDFFLPNI